MSYSEFIALSPITLLAAMVVIIMLVLCVIRRHEVSLGLTLLTFAANFLLLENLRTGMFQDIENIAVTPLLLFDSGTLFYSQLVAVSCFSIALMAYRYFRHTCEKNNRIDEFYLLLIMATIGAQVLLASYHFAGFFLGLVLLGISLFALIAYPVGNAHASIIAVNHSLESAVKYLVLSSIASAFLLLGMAFVYAQAGTLSMAGLQQYFNAELSSNSYFIASATLLLLVGIGFKLSLVPFHWWTPDVYQGAPTPVTALIATVAKGAVIVVLIRYFIATEAYRSETVLNILSAVVIVTMLVGNLLALTQCNVKRLLAYSSIAHIGYLFVAFVALSGVEARNGGTLAAEAVAIYITAYFITTLGAFAVVGAVSDESHSTLDRYDLKHYRGLFWRQPWVTACFILILLSLAGIPLTLGFVGKFYIFAAGVESELWWLLMSVVVGSAIGLYYYLRVIIVLVQKEPEQTSVVQQGHWLDTAIIFGLTAVLLLFGIYPMPLIDRVLL